MEFARIVSLKGRGDEAAVYEKATQMLDGRFSIHFHVWTTDEFIQFLEWARASHRLELEVLDVVRNHDESIFVLRRVTGAA